MLNRSANTVRKMAARMAGKSPLRKSPSRCCERSKRQQRSFILAYRDAQYRRSERWLRELGHGYKWIVGQPATYRRDEIHEATKTESFCGI